MTLPPLRSRQTLPQNDDIIDVGGKIMTWYEAILTYGEMQTANLYGINSIKDATEEQKKEYKQKNTKPEPAKEAYTPRTDILPYRPPTRKSKNFEVDYFGDAQEFIKQNPIWYDKSKNWWVWNKNKTCWERTDETDIMNLIDGTEHFNDTLSTEEQTKILRVLQRTSRLNAPKEIPDTWVQFKDKIVDIRDASIRDASPEHFCTNPIPWKVGDSADTPNIDALFKSWVAQEQVEQLYEILAFCCAPTYFIQRIFSFIGSGSNGKSTFLTILRRLIGKDNYCETDIDAMHTNKFETSKLYKKLVAFVSETNFDKISKTNKLKSLSSGLDVVSGEYKGKDSFSFINTAKILIATNNLPDTTDTSDGFYRRWLILDFPNSFPEKDVLGTIPEIEYCNLCRKIIPILNALQARRAFSNEGSVADRRKRYEARSNPLKQFIAECYDFDASGFVPSWQFCELFKGYCIKHGFRTWSQVEIGRWLIDQNIDGFERRQVTIDEKRVWAYYGLCQKNTKNIVPNTAPAAPDERSFYVSPIRVVGGYKVPVNVVQPVQNSVRDAHNSIEKSTIISFIKSKLPESCYISDILRHYGDTPENNALLQKLLMDGDIYEDGPGRVRVLE